MKPFADKDKQIEILDSRKLGFQNKENAKKLLMRYGYYEVVNGYKTFLLKENSDTEEYKDGETFEHLIALYELDKDIRNGVMKASLEIESSLRTAIAYTLAEDFGVHHRDYLHYRNFRQGDSIWGNGSPTNERAILLNKLNALTNKNIEPFNHYRSHHGHIPPWILLKETTFGNLKHLFKLLKGPQKDKVIAICYGIEISEVTDDKKSLFKDSLSVINSFRNR
ncbi:TPA: Abi family protein, partial [Streptococcus suis]